MNENFPWAEVGLAKKIGVNRGLLRALREKMIEGRDWLISGKSILWTQDAAELAARAFGASVEAIDQKNAASEPMVNGDCPVEAFRVTGRRVINPHKIEAENEHGQKVLVDVQHSRNFRPGMTVRAEKTETGWRLLGRCPRFPGRW